MAEEDRGRWIAAVPSYDDVRTQRDRFVVPLQVVSDVVESALQPRELGVDAVGCKNAGVESAQERVSNTIAPGEVAKLAVSIAGTPFPAGGSLRRGGGEPGQVDLQGGSLRKHPETEDMVRALRSCDDKRALPCDPADGEHDARARPQVEHPVTVLEDSTVRPICISTLSHATIMGVPALSRIACLVCLAACGESARQPPRDPAVQAPSAPGIEPSTSNVSPAPTASPPAALGGASGDGIERSTPVAVGRPDPRARYGSLEGYGRLSHFFEAIAALDEKRAGHDVRILQYGDSHTASDTATSVYRRILQERFGDGGRGFVSIGLPWKNYVQDGVHGGMSKEFEPQRLAHLNDGRFWGDGDYGLLGVAIGSDRRGARAWTQVTAPSSRIEIDYWEQPGGGSLDVLVDGTKTARIVTEAAHSGSGFYSVSLPDRPHQIELRAANDGALRVFGMALDRVRAGVVVDALGINGAQIYTPLHWNEEHFTEQLQHRAPDLVVLAYGTNESLDPKLDLADYERALGELLHRVGSAVPAASCLLLGPPDLARPTALLPPPQGDDGARTPPGQGGWSSWPRLGEVIEVQRRVAAAVGCAFYDQQAAMGGPGTMALWAGEPDPKGQRDRVHFTQAGYASLATSFATDLLRAYADWRSSQAAVPTNVATR